MAQELTQERLKEVLHYEPGAGVFTWLVTTRVTRAGTAAGAARRDGYWRVGIDRKRYLASRLAWLWMHGEWPRQEIDHRNGDPSDNRLVNLRLATRSQNMANRQVKGITWDKNKRKWVVSLKKDGKMIWVGRFTDPAEATAARRAAERAVHGEFVRGA